MLVHKENPQQTLFPGDIKAMATQQSVDCESLTPTRGAVSEAQNYQQPQNCETTPSWRPEFGHSAFLAAQIGPTSAFLEAQNQPTLALPAVANQTKSAFSTAQDWP